MDFNTYQELSKRTMPKMVEGKHEFYYDEKAFVNYTFGLAGETGEFVDLMKKEMFHGHPEDSDKKKKELGDILHYIAGLCTMNGWRMEEIATMNVVKIQERYPDGFSQERSINRVENYDISSLYPSFVTDNPKEYLKATEDWLRERQMVSETLKRKNGVEICDSCKGKGMVQIAPNVRGITTCDKCKGRGVI
jgi:NTP pyrophosphatase (non-canonical NTP hydrolase)